MKQNEEPQPEQAVVDLSHNALNSPSISLLEFEIIALTNGMRNALHMVADLRTAGLDGAKAQALQTHMGAALARLGEIQRILATCEMHPDASPVQPRSCPTGGFLLAEEP